MSDILHLQGSAYSQPAAALPAEKQPKGKLALKIFVVALLFFLIGETVFYLLIVPFASAVKVEVSGMSSVSAEAITQAAGLSKADKWGKINTEAVQRRLRQIPLIAEVTVIKKFPDRLIIDIVERKPVGILLASVGGRTVPMEIDKTGTVFKRVTKETSKLLPVISGLSFQNIRAGMKVHKQLVPLFMQLDLLQKKNPALLSEISEMKIEQKKYGGFDLVLYPVRTPVKVRTGDTLNEDRLQYMILTLDVIRELDRSSMIEELDVRGGTASYRLRGGTNE
ncbi:cell division protein FtsQ/DivIB [Treponema sp.]|uniref:cell division protein FtsQ/DivIB n=1 Tax=Treponema sp. TaxID=166 RepID=UPI003FA2F198